MKNLLFLIVAWCSLFAQAQRTISDSIPQKPTRAAMGVYDYGVRLPIFVPPSPQAQQYMRYGEIPIDISTGVPDINIPIYTLKANGLTIPISLSYHASGNKVEDVSSCVGLGWVLNAGGIITQTVNGGLPDDMAPFMFASSRVAGDYYSADREAYLGLRRVNFLWADLHTEGNGSFKKLISDRFFYRFNGNTGAFRADLSTGQLKHVSPSPIKINPIQGTDGLWTKIELTDAEGRIWTFKRFKPVQAVYQHHAQQIYHSYEYYPEKITFPNVSDEVTFTYTTGSRYLQTTLGQTGYFGQTPVYNFNFDLSSRTWGINVNFDTSDHINLNTQTCSIDPILLSTISWRGTTISFSYLKDRKDLMKDRLTHVAVSCNGCSICSADLTNTTYLGSKTENWRMLLSGVKVNAEQYLFNYNTMPLPNYTHYSLNCRQDFWGYYNGADNDRWIPFKWEWKGNPRLNNISAPQYIANLREAQEAYTQAGILTEIIHPTKGRTVFTYEQNQGSNVYNNIKPIQPPIDYFGGVRIKQINNYDGNTKLSTKSYAYVSGGPTITLTNWHFFEKKEFYFTPGSFPVHDFSMIAGMEKVPFKTDSYASTSSGYYPISSPFGQSLIYTKVIEYNGTPASNSGKTEYTFSGHFWGTYPVKNVDYGEERALLTSQKEYENSANNYMLKKETFHTYATIDLGVFATGLTIIEKDGYCFGLLPRNIPYAEDIPNFIYDYYNMYQIAQTNCFRKLELLSNTIVKTYAGASSTSESTQYLYDADYRILSPIAVIRTNSDGVRYKEEYLHSFNYPSDNICKAMTSKNMLSQVIEKKLLKNSTTIPLQSIKTDYMQSGAQIRTNKIKRAGQNNVMEERVVFHEYNAAGSAVYLSQGSSSKTVYIWGYNNKYPIVEIQNATYDEVTAIVSKAVLEAIAAKTAPTSSDWSTITALRTHAQLKKALVTVYKYIPDVGIVETIQPNGFTLYHTYDSYGRVTESYYMEGSTKRIVQTHEYNYRAQ